MQDEYGLHPVGSPHLLAKFCESDWSEVANSDTQGLATGEYKLDIDDKASNVELLQSQLNQVDVALLPAPVNYLSQAQAYAWLEIELKKEYVEMGLPPVGRIPWGNVSKSLIFMCPIIVISRVNFNVSNCACKTKFTLQNSLL